jgi:uncharacterized membrane protein YoaK (UPF0700 family)
VTRLDPRTRAYAAALAAVAGYADGAAFLMTGGFFVSFMSGNSTRMSVGFARGAAEAGFAAALVAAFVAGVVSGASVRRLAPRRPEPLILAGLTAVLVLCGGLAAGGYGEAAALLLALAMGAENTLFAEAGEVRVGLTYVTGTLVRVGKGVTAALFGEDRFRWAPHLLLWLSLVAGGAVGATAYARLGPPALWIAAAAAAVLTALSVKIFPIEDEDVD